MISETAEAVLRAPTTLPATICLFAVVVSSDGITAAVLGLAVATALLDVSSRSVGTVSGGLSLSVHDICLCCAPNGALCPLAYTGTCAPS